MMWNAFPYRRTESIVSGPSKCQVCGRELASNTGTIYCLEHELEYETRQLKKVPTEELSSKWGDRLSIWRDCPHDLLGEQYANRLYFRRRWGDWLVFWMVYPARLPDWIAVSPQNGIVRRFVEVSEQEVMKTLIGTRAYPSQQDISQRWGRPEAVRPLPSVSFLSDLLSVDRKKLRMQEHMDLVPIPVFGLPRSSGFRLIDFAIRQGSYKALTVRLSFVKQVGAQAGGRHRDHAIFVVNTSVSLGSDYPSSNDSSYRVPISLLVSSVSMPHLDSGITDLWREAGDVVFQHIDLQAPKGLRENYGEFYRGQKEIAGAVFSCDLLYWQGKGQTSVFFAKQQGMDVDLVPRLTGWTRGISIETVIDLLGRLEEINMNIEILSQYQADLDLPLINS